jgi:hypothetical protein
MQTAPVILFAYNRPELLQQTLNCLSVNKLAGECNLYIFCDGPRNNAHDSELKRIENVRKISKSVDWAADLQVIESGINKGLAKSVIDGVSIIIDKYEKAIVVEDDVLLSPYFLQFMNDALNAYVDNEKILSIGSWTYFVGKKTGRENFFLRYPDSIAWATFKRSWELFEKDSSSLLNKLRQKNLMDRFNGGLKQPYFEKMLMDQINGKIDSWAIRWTATSVLYGKLNLYPSISLSKHVGFVENATHEAHSHDYNKMLELSNEPIPVSAIPTEESVRHFELWKKFIQREFISSSSLKSRIVRRIKNAFK